MVDKNTPHQKICFSCKEKLPELDFPFTDRSRILRGKICKKCYKALYYNRRKRGLPQEERGTVLGSLEMRLTNWVTEEGLSFSESEWDKVCTFFRNAKLKYVLSQPCNKEELGE